MIIKLKIPLELADDLADFFDEDDWFAESKESEKFAYSFMRKKQRKWAKSIRKQIKKQMTPVVRDSLAYVLTKKDI